MSTEEKFASSLKKRLALARMQMGRAVKSAKNPFFGKNYADLSEVISVIEESLHEQGLAVFQEMDTSEAEDRIRTVIIDAETGETHSFTGCKIVSKDPNDPQKQGSAITYARRYSLALTFNMAQEDDDANKASHNKPATPAAPSPKALTKDAFNKMVAKIKDGSLTKEIALATLQKTGRVMTEQQGKEFDSI